MFYISVMATEMQKPRVDLQKRKKGEMSDHQQDGMLGGPNAHLPHKKTKTVKQPQTEENRSIQATYSCRQGNHLHLIFPLGYSLLSESV